jgi:hypothetical protein
MRETETATTVIYAAKIEQIQHIIISNSSNKHNN